MIQHLIGAWRQGGIAILKSDKAEFKSKLIRKDKEGFSILVKGTIPQEDTIIINIYIPNLSSTNYIKEISLKLKPQLDPNVILNDFNTTLTIR